MNDLLYKNVQEAEFIINKVLQSIEEKNYIESKNDIDEAYKKFQDCDFKEGLSICLSLESLVEYSSQKIDYEKALALAQDGMFMANRANSTTALLINEFIFGNINFAQGNRDVSLIHYNNALKLSAEEDKYNLAESINTRIKQLQNGMNYSMPTKSDPLISLLKISQSIAALRDIDELLSVIAHETKNAICADRCTVFLWDEYTDELWSKVALGLDDSQEIRFPAEKGIAGYVLKTGNPINITDAYNDDRFNPEVDKSTGYRTKTILCVPIINQKGEKIGVFQVLNKIDGIFTKHDEELLKTIGLNASVALENAQLFEKVLSANHEQKRLFDSFIDTLATSIDARDKITAGHSMRVKMYSGLIATELGMNKEDKEILEKAASLHDIGKIGIRDSVLQKEGKLTYEEYKHIQEHVRITHNILNKISVSSDFRRITEIACSHHEKWDGSGYYRHLKGEEITLGGRILAVADVFDAITSKRHYRDKMPIKNVLGILIKDSGTHFDKKLVDIFMSIPLNRIIKVFLQESNGKFQPKDEELLKNYDLNTIYKLSSLENPTPEQQELLELFDMYYKNTQSVKGDNQK